MEQEKIEYSDIMLLGFHEEIQEDQVYFDIHGYEYSIITLNLTKKISLDWAKETQLCELIRINNTHEEKVVARTLIYNLEHLKQTIDFFTVDNYWT